MRCIFFTISIQCYCMLAHFCFKPAPSSHEHLHIRTVDIPLRLRFYCCCCCCWDAYTDDKINIIYLNDRLYIIDRHIFNELCVCVCIFVLIPLKSHNTFIIIGMTLALFKIEMHFTNKLVDEQKSTYYIQHPSFAHLSIYNKLKRKSIGCHQLTRFNFIFDWIKMRRWNS